MSKETFNFRNPDTGEVQEIEQKVKQRALANQKYKVLSQLLMGKTVDVTVSPEIFEALNRERMEFDEILKLHPDQAKSAMDEVELRRQDYDDGKWWNPKSKAKWGYLGEIPYCLYIARPREYWKDKRILYHFFNMYPKFRLSSKPL
jgi:hypothetical protein